MYSLSNYHLAMKKIGSLADTIINAFKKIVLNDGATFEDSTCLNSKLNQLTNNDISLFSEYSNNVNNTLGMVEPSESTSYETDYNKYTNSVTPTLLLIPNGRKFDNLFSAIGPNLTFSGTGDKSRLNKGGNIEFTKRNLYQFSEDFTNAYWTVSVNGTLTNNFATAPDGTTTAARYTKTSAVNTVASIAKSTAIYNVTGIHTLSVYFKNINSNTVLIRLDSSGNTANVTYNFSTKTLTNSGDNILGSSAIDVGNGWIRVTATANITSTTFTTDFANLFPEAAGAQIYVWGAQIEKNSSASVYQKTTTSNLTARIDYSNSSAALLLEPSRTNLVLSSADVTIANWGLNRVTVANTSNTTPIVGVTARKITVSTLGALRCNQVITGLTAGARYVYKQYIKKDNLDTVTFLFGDNFETVNSTISYTFSTNSFTGDEGFRYTVTKTATILTNGWVLIKIYVIIPIGQTTLRFNSCLPGTSFANAVAVGDAVFVSNAQIEAGLFDTSDIITTSATVTRTTDKYNVTIPTTSNGTCVINVIDNIPQSGGGTHLFGCLSLIGTNGIYLSKTNGGRLRLWTAASSSIYATTITNLKLAITFDGTNINVWENGVKVVTNYAYALSNVNLIESSNSIETINSIKTLAFYNSILSNSQCISLTT